MAKLDQRGVGGNHPPREARLRRKNSMIGSLEGSYWLNIFFSFSIESNNSKLEGI